MEQVGAFAGGRKGLQCSTNRPPGGGGGEGRKHCVDEGHTACIQSSYVGSTGGCAGGGLATGPGMERSMWKGSVHKACVCDIGWCRQVHKVSVYDVGCGREDGAAAHQCDLDDYYTTSPTTIRHPQFEITAAIPPFTPGKVSPTVLTVRLLIAPQPPPLSLAHTPPCSTPQASRVCKAMVSSPSTAATQTTTTPPAPPAQHPAASGALTSGPLPHTARPPLPQALGPQPLGEGQPA